MPGAEGALMYGLVLEGGGGKGAYQVGACRALIELGKEIGAVAGTSVGALNGAMFVQNDMEKAYELWYNLSPSRIFNLTDEELSAFRNIGASHVISRKALIDLFRRIRKIISDKGLDIQPLIDMIKENIDEKKIRKSPIEFGIVTVDITGRKAYEIYKEEIPVGKLIDYIIASASFPLFRPAVIDGRTYLDGGLYNNLPIDMVSRKGYKDIIVIRTFGIGLKKKIDTSGLNIVNIEPYENLGPILDFNPERARKNIKMGYFDTIKVFRGLRGRMYYVESLSDENFFINYLACLPASQVKSLCEIFGIETCDSKRIIFEIIVPKIADLLGLDASSTYEDVAIGLMEKAAEKAKIERFRIYTFKELYNNVVSKYEYYSDDFTKDIPAFLRGNEIITRLTKEKIIASIANIIFGSESKGLPA